MPLSFVNVTFNPTGRADPAARAFADAELELVYGYLGFPDDNRLRFGLRYDLEREDGGAWVITGARHEPRPGPEPLAAPPGPGVDSGSGPADPTERRPLALPSWVRFPTEATRSEPFLVLHPPGLAEAGRVVELAEQARQQLAPRLRFGRSDEVHLIQVARDRAEYDEVVGEDLGPDNLAVVSVLSLPGAPRRPAT